jgi:predicted hydrocarbon binding protein
MALKVMPLSVQFKLGLSNMQDGIRKLWSSHGQQTVLRLEETRDAWLYINETCPECAGKAADVPMCWLFVGVLHETTRWFTGKDFEIVETECRTMGAPACVWRISKTPKE